MLSLTSLGLLAISSILAPELCAILAFSKKVQFPLITTTALSFIKPEGTSEAMQSSVEVRFSRVLKDCREKRNVMEVENLILQINLEDITMLPNLRFARKRHSRKESLIQEYSIRAAVSAACNTEGYLQQCIAEISGCF